MSSRPSSRASGFATFDRFSDNRPSHCPGIAQVGGRELPEGFLCRIAKWLGNRRSRMDQGKRVFPDGSALVWPGICPLPDGAGRFAGRKNRLIAACMTAEEYDIYHYLNRTPENFVSIYDIAKDLGSRRSFAANRDWAYECLSRLEGEGLVDKNASGEYRVRRRS